MAASSLRRSVRVLITAIGGAGPGDQVLKALRMVKGEFYELYGTDISPNCIQAGWVSDFRTVPRANDPNYIATLLDLCALWQIEALLVCSEPELVAVSGAIEEFVPEASSFPSTRRT